MSNVKEVRIQGEIPFDCGGHDPEAINLLGALNMPSFGLRIRYGNLSKYIPNEYGGRTAIYPYEITGREAVAVTWLQDAVALLRRIGKVSDARYYDAENCTPWEVL